MIGHEPTVASSRSRRVLLHRGDLASERY
jgi:hypothetical protein